MTFMPALRLNLHQKGHLSVGADGDVTIFDDEAVRDRATFADPALPPKGICYVLVGGEVVLKDGVIIRDNCGKSVRT